MFYAFPHKYYTFIVLLNISDFFEAIMINTDESFATDGPFFWVI